MPISATLVKKLEAVPKELRGVLLDLVEELERQREESVTKREFNELREALRRLAQEVQRLAEAQRKTEERVGKLEEAIERLAEAQRRTEERLNELAEAQRRTEEEIKKLAQGQRRLRGEIGGLSRSVAYALENEAFRRLPQFLKGRDVEVLERMVRTEVAGEEINLFARIKRNGEEMLLVGEATLRLDDASKLRQLKRKAAMVETEMGQKVFPVIVTHFAKRTLLEKAERAGVLVVQSFEW